LTVGLHPHILCPSSVLLTQYAQVHQVTSRRKQLGGSKKLWKRTSYKTEIGIKCQLVYLQVSCYAIPFLVPQPFKFLLHTCIQTLKTHWSSSLAFSLVSSSTMIQCLGLGYPDTIMPLYRFPRHNYATNGRLITWGTITDRRKNSLTT